eukprot:g19403.t1
MLSLSEVALGLYPSSSFEQLEEMGTPLMLAVSVFILISLVFLLNLLVAQLNSAYQAVFEDMVGFARLNRGKITLDTVASVSQRRWGHFQESFHFEERMEFNEGDIGLAGGIQILEPANLNPTNVDTIRRYGASASSGMSSQSSHDSQHDKETDGWALGVLKKGTELVQGWFPPDFWSSKGSLAPPRSSGLHQAHQEKKAKNGKGSKGAKGEGAEAEEESTTLADGVVKAWM